MQLEKAAKMKFVQKFVCKTLMKLIPDEVVDEFEVVQVEVAEVHVLEIAAVSHGDPATRCRRGCTHDKNTLNNFSSK